MNSWIIVAAMIVVFVAMVAGNLYVTRRDAMKDSVKDGMAAGIKWVLTNATVYASRCRECQEEIDRAQDVPTDAEKAELDAMNRAKALLNDEDD